LAALESEGVTDVVEADRLAGGEFCGVEGQGAAVVAGDGELTECGVDLEDLGRGAVGDVDASGSVGCRVPVWTAWVKASMV
jgi:hypothetical protein